MVVTAIRTCPQCGNKLPPDAPEGLCPTCILRLGLRSEQSGNADSGDSGASGPGDVAGSVAAQSGEGSNLPPTSPYKSGAPFTPPQPTELAPYFPQLEILELVGQGGMGAVYKARQRQLGRIVALKILPPEVAQDPAFAERFTREAQALAQLNHPHIVTIHDFGQTGRFFYLLMEFVDGTNLRPLIADRKLEPRSALAIVPQICEALQYAHDEGIVHRDIKPENILIDRKGRVKIADFGLAKLLRRGAGDSALSPRPFTLTGLEQVLGTPHYMAPEQMDDPLKVDHRADIYALGVVFYEMLTGDLPRGRFAPPSQKVQVDVRLDEVVLRALEQEPQRRYQQASEVKTDVESISRSPQPQSVARPESAKGAAIPAHHASTPFADSGRATPPAEEAIATGRDILQGPADAMMLAAGAAILTAMGVTHWLWSKWNAGLLENTKWTLVGMSVAQAVYALFIVAGGLLMRGLRFRIFALLCVVIVGLFLPAVVALNVVMEFSRIPQWPVVIPMWLGVPVAVWATIKLFRRDVRAAFEARARSRAVARPTAARWWLLLRTATLLAALVGGMLVAGPWQSVEIRAPFTQGLHIQWFLLKGYESGLGLAAGVLFAIAFFITLAAFPLRRAAVPVTTILLGLLIASLMTSYGYHPPLLDRPEVADVVPKIHALNPTLQGDGSTNLDVVHAARKAGLIDYWQRIIPAFYLCLAMALVTVIAATLDFVLLRQAAAVEPSHEKTGTGPVSLPQTSAEPPTVNAAPGKRPFAVTLFGVLNILIGTLLSVMQAVDLFSAEGFRGMFPASVQGELLFRAWMAVAPPLQYLASNVLLVAGIGLLLVKRWGRTASLGFSVFKIGMFVVELPLYMMYFIAPLVLIAESELDSANAAEMLTGLVYGLPVVICFELFFPILLLVAMQRPNVKAAFQTQTRSWVAQSPTSSRWLVPGIVLMVVVLAGIGGLIVAPRIFDGGEKIIPTLPKTGERWFGNKGEEHVMFFGPDIPTVSDRLARHLDLDPSQREAMDQAFQMFFREVNAIKDQYTLHETDEQGHQITTILPLRDILPSLVERFWSKLDSVLDGRQLTLGRKVLWLSGGMFESAGDGYRIEIWRVGQINPWYHWKESYPGRANVTPSSDLEPSSGPELPENLRRFWKEPESDDATNLQGVWVAVAGERNGGQPLSADEIGGVKVTFERDHMRVTMQGRNDEGTFKLDVSQAPKRIAVTRTEGPNRFGIMDGVYELDGDHLRLCMGEPEDRPTEFKTRAGSRLIALDLVRQNAVGPIAFEAVTGKLVQTGTLVIDRLGKFEVTYPRPFAGTPTFIFPREQFTGPGRFAVQQSTPTGFTIEVTDAAFTPQQPVRLGWLATGSAAPAATDDARIQGTWNYVSEAYDGKVTDPQEFKLWKEVFAKGEYTGHYGDLSEKGTYKLDPAKTPKTIDQVCTEGSDKGFVFVGIYELDGDNLKLCFAPRGSPERPQEFSATRGSQRNVIVLKREKPAGILRATDSLRSGK